MGFKLGDISPVAGVISGEGTFGDLASSGALGVGAALASEARKKKSDGSPDVTVSPVTEAKVPGMKKGGKVSSASSRADGCAIRGKTKGRMV